VFVCLQGNDKNNEGKQMKKPKLKEKKKGQKISSEAESFKHTKVKYPTHLKMAM
jgi:hypothetical protein